MPTNSQQAEHPRPRTAAMNRGFDVLELVVDSGQVRLAEVAKALGISRATAFRALSALRRRGYIEHVPSEQIYRLGTGFITLAARSAASSIVRLASSVMADLRNETRETVNLALMRGGRLIYVSIFDGPQALRITPRVGAEAALHATALGKAVLMMMSPDDQDLLLGTNRIPRSRRIQSPLGKPSTKNSRRLWRVVILSTGKKRNLVACAWPCQLSMSVTTRLEASL